MPAKQQVTRVAVDDDTWRAFRQAALDRGVSVSAYLAKLVQAELRRRPPAAVAAVARDATEVETTITALVDVRLAIDELDAIAGRLARAATTHGGSGRDVASSLQLTEKAARAAYGSQVRS